MLAAPADDVMKSCKMMQRKDRTVMTIPETRTACLTMSAVLPSRSQAQGGRSRQRIPAGKLESRTLEEERMMAQELMTTLKPSNVFENILATICDSPHLLESMDLKNQRKIFQQNPSDQKYVTALLHPKAEAH